MSFASQNWSTDQVTTILEWRTHTIIQNFFCCFPREVREQVHPLFQTVFKTFLKDKEKTSVTLFQRKIRSY